MTSTYFSELKTEVENLYNDLPSSLRGRGATKFGQNEDSAPGMKLLYFMELVRLKYLTSYSMLAVTLIRGGLGLIAYIDKGRHGK